jgi:hypothetical protein
MAAQCLPGATVSPNSRATSEAILLRLKALNTLMDWLLGYMIAAARHLVSKEGQGRSRHRA